MISIECPTCFKTFNVKPELIGKRVKCKDCGTPIRVEEPILDEGDATFDDLGTPRLANPDVANPSPSPEPTSSVISVKKKHRRQTWLTAETSIGWQIASVYLMIGTVLLWFMTFGEVGPSMASSTGKPAQSFFHAASGVVGYFILWCMLISVLVLYGILSVGLWKESPLFRFGLLGARCVGYLCFGGLLITEIASRTRTANHLTPLGVIIGIAVAIHIPIVNLFGYAGLTRTWSTMWLTLLCFGAVIYSELVAPFIIIYPSMVTARRADRATVSSSNLKQLALGLHNYHDSHGTLPPGGTFATDGVGQHSWQAMLLPFIDRGNVHRNINFDVPWDAPANSLPFRQEIQEYLVPGREPVTDDSKYALSHFAANAHLFDKNSRMRLRHIDDGTANTILLGEAADVCRAWGDPENYRFPEVGLNKGSLSFGTPGRDGAYFVFADGSARFVSDKIDPKVLTALGTPRGGEVIPEFTGEGLVKERDEPPERPK